MPTYYIVLLHLLKQDNIYVPNSPKILMNALMESVVVLIESCVKLRITAYKQKTQMKFKTLNFQSF